MFAVMGLIVVLFYLPGHVPRPDRDHPADTAADNPHRRGYGFSLIWFGVVVVKLLEIGLVTPPIGLNVFVIKSIVGPDLRRGQRPHLA
jgi:C4-dicarboxylate transporter DctM subunit